MRILYLSHYLVTTLSRPNLVVGVVIYFQ